MSQRDATPWWGFAAEAFASDPVEKAEPEPDVAEEPDPPMVEEGGPPGPTLETTPAEESEPDSPAVVEPEPPVVEEPAPERSTVWPASWAVQTAASFAEPDDTGETTHRFPGVRPTAPEPDDEDLVGEAEPTIEPTEFTD